MVLLMRAYLHSTPTFSHCSRSCLIFDFDFGLGSLTNTVGFEVKEKSYEFFYGVGTVVDTVVGTTVGILSAVGITAGVAVDMLARLVSISLMSLSRSILANLPRK